VTDGAVTVLLALGGNMGDRLGEMQAGLDALAVRGDVEIADVSGVWESGYVGPGDQDDYFNACCVVRTALTPRRLLDVLKAVESDRGRAADGHMKPRPLDIDILMYGDRVVDEPGLTIPHPRMTMRAFVLEPLNEVAAETAMPDSNETVGTLCEKIRGAESRDVRRRDDCVLRIPKSR
jgi:2-amino-4-hydroxy-6-hydroxymethyldihydropteridine diphosphokinase